MTGKRLYQKCAVVTGAASGIGRGIVTTFLDEGAYVVAVDIDKTKLASLQSIWPQDRCMTLACDVADESGAVTATARVVDRFGKIDCLVTAAGISRGGVAGETTLKTWETVMRVNVTGTFLWVKAVLPQMCAQGKGSIITISSQRALAGGDASAPYVTSKGAILAFTKSLALDYAASGIRVNSILPGAIDTEMLQSSFTRKTDPEAARKRSLDRHPLHRFGQPREVALAATYLASDESGFVTGVHLPVDGGWLAA